jgi:4-diphosphocytidyl-2-C-methyl-D-erythritol kinase
MGLMKSPPLPNKGERSALAKAKVNLCLPIVGKRSDGYHLLQSLVVFAEYGDRLTVTPAEHLSFSATGPFAGGIDPNQNSVMKAAQALRQLAGNKALGAHIHLEKNLPIASGIGGGTADAAVTLHLLENLWQIESTPELIISLGADVPVCYHGQPCWMEGIGEVITPLTAFPTGGIVLVNPGISVPTPSMFQQLLPEDFFTPLTPLPVHFEDMGQLVRFLQMTGNSFQRIACKFMPVIGEVLASITATKSVFTQMSGSGATCFGLYPTEAKANTAAAAIAGARPDWWVVAASLHP